MPARIAATLTLTAMPALAPAERNCWYDGAVVFLFVPLVELLDPKGVDEGVTKDEGEDEVEDDAEGDELAAEEELDTVSLLAPHFPNPALHPSPQ